MSDTGTRLRKLVIEHLGVDESKITLEAKIRDDLGADSMGVVELIMATEDEFDITIGEDEEESVGDGTFGKLCEMVDSKLAEVASA